jgi:hypothetical protein
MLAADWRTTTSLGAAEADLTINRPGMGALTFQLSGTFTATVTFEVTDMNGSSPSWVAVPATNVNTGVAATTATAAGIYRLDASGFQRVRARCSAFTSGPIDVVANASHASTSTSTATASVSSAITSVVPGTAATNLGKAEDAAHTSGDVGVMVLGVQQTTQAPLGADGDYEPYLLDANGSKRTVAGGYTTIITTTLTRPADTTAYQAGDEMTDTGGAIQTITGAARFSGGSGIIQGVFVSQSTLWTTRPSLELWVYDTTSTPVADNGAFAPTDGVTDTCIGIIPLSTSYTGTVNQGLDSGTVSIPFKCVGSANLFFRVVVRNAAQDSANSGVSKFRFRILQD